MKEEEILKFYEGDVKGDHPLFSDPKAYVTWNALLMEGTDTEYARSAEGRRLNPAFLENPQIVIDLSKKLFDLMPYSQEKRRVFRVERECDWKIFAENSFLQSFVSTSDAGFLSSYTDKRSLVLMEIDIPSGTKCADLKDLLDHYLKEEESEILLPPFMEFTYENLPVTDEIRSIRDCDGNEPSVYVHVTVGKTKTLRIEAEENAFAKKTIEGAVRFYEALNRHETAEREDKESYLKLKSGIRSAVYKGILNDE